MKSKDTILLILLASSAGLCPSESFSSEFTRQQFLNVRKVRSESGNLSATNIQFHQIEKFSSDSSQKNALSHGEGSSSSHSEPRIEEILSDGETPHIPETLPEQEPQQNLTTAIQRAVPSVLASHPEGRSGPTPDLRRSSTIDLVNAAVGQSLRSTETEANVNIRLQNEKRGNDGSVNKFNIDISIQRHNIGTGQTPQNLLLSRIGSQSTAQLPTLRMLPHDHEDTEIIPFPKVSFGNERRAQEAPQRRLANPNILIERRRSSLPQAEVQVQQRQHMQREFPSHTLPAIPEETTLPLGHQPERNTMHSLYEPSHATDDESVTSHHSVNLTESRLALLGDLALADTQDSTHSARSILVPGNRVDFIQWKFDSVFGDGCDLCGYLIANGTVLISTGSLFLCGGLGSLSDVIRQQQKEKNPLGVSHVGLIIVATINEIMNLLDDCKTHGGLYYNPHGTDHYESMAQSLRRLSKHIGRDQQEAFCVHSTGKHGVHIDPLQILLPKYHGNIFVRKIRRPLSLPSLREVLIREIGKEYNANLAELKKATRGKNKKKKDPLTAFCSEAVAIIFMELGILPRSFANNFTPASFCSHGEDILPNIFDEEVPLKTAIKYDEGSCCLLC